ncbi:MAG: hypothetical protein H7X91_12015 [Burkholderiales bacterium]|nr:hypothetical protein [Burkholderiales bacterium]
MTPFWSRTCGRILNQGDLLTGCLIPVFNPDFGNSATEEVPISEADLIIVTQTCDLEHGKVSFGGLCPIYPLSEFEEVNSKFKKKGQWEEVRKGRVPGLHLLASPLTPQDNQKALVVDFGQIFSLPFGYLAARAEALGNRWRLDSPFLEHFSQAFARFFMRVGLPSTIPPFK